MKPGLYVTATPIGNLKDITLRAIEVMQKADVIFCEDKRLTARLCHAHEIKTPLQTYHDHNGAEIRPLIIERLENGEKVVLVSDAGTPLISDPGYKLIREIRDAGLDVFTVPGPSATTAALSIAGAPTDRFMFAGFLPPKSTARKKALLPFKTIDASLVFYESGPRLAGSLRDMAEILGDRPAAIARELTKLHEEVREDTLTDLSAFYEDHPPRGEIVIIIHPPEHQELSQEDIVGILTDLLEEHSVKDAAKHAAEQTGLPKKQLYQLALELKKSGA